MGNHYVEICEYGYRHGTCRCAGPKSVRMVECSMPSHAENSKAYNPPAGPMLPDSGPTPQEVQTAVASIPNDVTEYVTGPFKAKPLTKEIWETLISGVVKDQAPNMAQALDWLHEQYGDWEN